MYGKNFKFMVFRFLENALDICIFTHASSSLKLQAGFLENLFHQDERSENHDLLYENLIKKYEDDFIFCMVYNFSKCDGLTVL